MAGEKAKRKMVAGSGAGEEKLHKEEEVVKPMLDLRYSRTRAPPASNLRNSRPTAANLRKPRPQAPRAPDLKSPRPQAPTTPKLMNPTMSTLK